jgi:hypothetical protein
MDCWENIVNLLIENPWAWEYLADTYVGVFVVFKTPCLFIYRCASVGTGKFLTRHWFVCSYNPSSFCYPFTKLFFYFFLFLPFFLDLLSLLKISCPSTLEEEARPCLNYVYTKGNETVQVSGRTADYYGKMALETLWLVASNMINSTGNAGKRYPQLRDHFKKSCCQPCAHAGCLISPCQRSRKWPQEPYTELSKQLLTIACLAIETIIGHVCLTALQQCECQVITAYCPLGVSVLFYCYYIKKRKMNKWEFDTYTRPNMWYL